MPRGIYKRNKVEKERCRKIGRNALKNPKARIKHLKGIHKYWAKKEHSKAQAKRIQAFMDSSKGSKWKEEQSKRISSFKKREPEKFEKILKKRIKTIKSKKVRKKISKSVKKLYKIFPKKAFEHSQKLRAFYSNPKKRKERSNLIIKLYQDKPYIKKKISQTLKKMYKKHPELITINKEKQKAIWNIKKRKEHSNIIKSVIKKHPELIEALREKQRKLSKHKHLTKSGDIVISKPELLIADFLYDNKIKFEYEKELFLENDLFYPDFWLPKYKRYIEYFGDFGYLGKGISKRTKYKIKVYKKHKIKLIPIFRTEKIILKLKRELNK